MKLLELAGKFTLVVALVTYIVEIPARQRDPEAAIKQKHYRAWDLINSECGSAGARARRDALQDLNEDGVSLSYVDSAKAYLREVQLPKQILSAPI